MKPDNKLGKLRFAPEQAFETLRTKGRRAFAISKEELERRIADERHEKSHRRIKPVKATP